jgi:hypothetical protein
MMNEETLIETFNQIHSRSESIKQPEEFHQLSEPMSAKIWVKSLEEMTEGVIVPLGGPEPPKFAPGQQVLLSEECAIHGMFPCEVGAVLEHRYSEKHRWLYMVEFKFGTFPLSGNELLASDQ